MPVTGATAVPGALWGTRILRKAPVADVFRRANCSRNHSQFTRQVKLLTY